MKVLKLITDPYSSFYNSVAGKRRSIPRRALAVTAIALSALTLLIPAGVIIHSLVNRVKNQPPDSTQHYSLSVPFTPGAPISHKTIAVTPGAPDSVVLTPGATIPKKSVEVTPGAPKKIISPHQTLMHGKKDRTGLKTGNNTDNLLRHILGDEPYKSTGKAETAGAILLLLGLDTIYECQQKGFKAATKEEYLNYFNKNRPKLIATLARLGYITKK